MAEWAVLGLELGYSEVLSVLGSEGGGAGGLVVVKVAEDGCFG